MTEPLEVHTCELCGQRQFDRCPECDGEGSCMVYADESWASPQVWADCEKCYGSGWVETPCGCPKRPEWPLPTVDQILAKYRSEKEKSA